MRPVTALVARRRHSNFTLPCSKFSRARENATTYLHAGGLLLAFNGDELGFECLLRDPKGHLDRVIILVSKAVSTGTQLGTVLTGRVSFNCKHTTCSGRGLPSLGSARMVNTLAEPPRPPTPGPLGACSTEPSRNPRTRRMASRVQLMSKNRWLLVGGCCFMYARPRPTYAAG